MKKTKKFLSLLLAMVMSLSLAAPVFAAEPEDDPNEGIMLLSTLYDSKDLNLGTGSFNSDKFTTTPGNGKYIKVWYANRTNYNTTVYLFRVNANGDELVTYKTFAPNSYIGNEIWYPISNTEPITFRVYVKVNNNYPLSGYLAVSQESVKPA